jgi:hypothetical protein
MTLAESLKESLSKIYYGGSTMRAKMQDSPVLQAGVLQAIQMPSRIGGAKSDGHGVAESSCQKQPNGCVSTLHRRRSAGIVPGPKPEPPA